MARLPSVALASALALAAPSEARAAVVESDGVIITTVVVGTLGGLTTSVGAMVYALDQRDFTPPWMVVSFFSAAVTGAMTTAIVIDGLEGQNVGALFGAVFYAAITLWPGYWAVRTALSEGEPGESEARSVAERRGVGSAEFTSAGYPRDSFDAEVAPRTTIDPAIDPANGSAAMRGPRAGRRPIAALSFAF